MVGGDGARLVGPGTTGGAPPAVEDVQVTPVTAHGWRLSDARLPLGDPMRVLGYVERRGDVLEVMQLGRGFECHEVATMDDALGLVVASWSRIARARQG